MLTWVAILVVGWCVASVVTALALGTFLRRRAEATDPEGALRPLDTGPLRLWLGEVPAVPESPASLSGHVPYAALDGFIADLPAQREQVGQATTVSR